MAAPRTHGYCSGSDGTSPTYRSWQAMVQRCTNPRNASWRYYGGRGVRVCDHLRASVVGIVESIGERPEGVSLDRIESTGHYSCGSCSQCLIEGWTGNIRWSTAAEQAQNRRAQRRTRAQYDRRLAAPTCRAGHERATHGYHRAGRTTWSCRECDRASEARRKERRAKARAPRGEQAPPDRVRALSAAVRATGPGKRLPTPWPEIAGSVHPDRESAMAHLSRTLWAERDQITPMIAALLVGPVDTRWFLSQTDEIEEMLSLADALSDVVLVVAGPAAMQVEQRAGGAIASRETWKWARHDGDQAAEEVWDRRPEVAAPLLAEAVQRLD